MYEFNRKGKTTKKRIGGKRRKKLQQREILFIQNEINENCWITLKMIKEKIKDNFNIDVSERTISKHISEFNYSIKRTTLVSERAVTELNNEHRIIFCSTFFRLNNIFYLNNIFFG